MSKIPRPNLFIFLLLALLAVIIVGSLVFPPDQWVPAAQWGEALHTAGAPGVVVFLVAGTLATSVGLPRQLVAFIAGLAYGTAAGLLISLVSALLGCYLTIRFSQHFLAGWVTTRFPMMVATLNRFLRRDVFLKILVLRLQPLGTNLLTNLCVGFTRISHRLFLTATAVGYIPQMLVFSLLGSGVRVGSNAQIVVSILLLCISLILGAYLYKKHTRETAYLST